MWSPPSIDRANLALSLTEPNGVTIYNYLDASDRRFRNQRLIFQDLTKRPTPPLAPEKPLSKRQKRRLKGKNK